MSSLLAQPWLVVVGPFVLACVIALFFRRESVLAPLIAVAGPFATLALGAGALAADSAAPAGGYEWLTSSTGSLHIGWAVDSLTALMLVVVGSVAACVVVFSAGYMHGDSGWGRYFALLSLFTGSMNLLVIGDSLTTLFVGWELVGACSYLLIGFWYRKPAAAAAAIKAFLTTRVGDVGLLLGIAALWVATGSDTYEAVIAAIPQLSGGVIDLAAVCLAIGAMGKSAQFPLHAWLPDAMEGPTPVSALIHAATMVAAGVFLGARLWPLFDASPAAQLLLLAAGVISALGAALVATVQRDIKKVLAYSTVSQLGFMFAALGVGAWEAAFFHLVAHAAFKALLFLGSGSVIHGTGTQDIHAMGGLRRTMPVTFGVWLIGVFALAGVAPFAGFFSKDAVLEAVWHASPVAGSLLFVTSALTALYVARTTRLAFFGAPAPGLHAHESPASMLIPLAVLAVPAALLGFAHAPFTEALGAHPEPLALPVSAAALLLAAVGGIIGWRLSPTAEKDAAFRARLGRAGDVLAEAYRWDRLVDRVIVTPAVTLSRVVWAWGDRLLVDGAVEASALLARVSASSVSRLQTGDAQSYGAALAAGVALLLAAAVWLGT